MHEARRKEIKSEEIDLTLVVSQLQNYFSMNTKKYSSNVNCIVAILHVPEMQRALNILDKRSRQKKLI